MEKHGSATVTVRGPVQNIDTTLHYDTIQAAIDAPQTLDGHTITVEAGTYDEHVVVKKTLSLIGENKKTTIIDGNGTGTVVRITANNVTVTGFTVQNGYSGLIFEYCNGSVVSGNLMSNNQMDGIEFYYSNNNDVEDNVVSNNSRGIEIYYSDHNTLISNNASNNGYGIRLRRSTNNTLRNNNLTNNHRNFAIEGESLSEFIHKIDTSNVVDGKSIHYLVNQENKQIPAQAGYVAAINSINITVRNANLTKNSQGVLFLNTTDSTIENVNASYNSYGIVLVWSNCTKVIGNTISHASEEGITLGVAVNNEIIGNTVGLGARTGIYLYQSRNNTIYHNNFIQNWDQAYSEESTNTWDDGYPSGGNYWSNYTGVDLLSGTYQNMTGSDGIGDKPYNIDEYNRDRYPLMKPYGGPHDIGIVNVTTSKTLVTQGHNLSINVKIVNYGAHNENFNVTTYANKIIIQTKTITLTNRNSTTITFIWNTTGVEKGDYTISARASVVLGETETTDNTKVDGTVAVLSPGHDVAIKGVTPSKTVVAQNYSLSIRITAKNYGNFTETFNVTAYYNSNIINYTTVTNLPPGEETAVTFTWDTTGVAKGNYTIKAEATPVPGETDTTDNTYIDGWVIVAMVGDVNADGIVDMKDIAPMAARYGAEKGDPEYVANYDLNGDGVIDIIDIAVPAAHYGETDP